MIRSITVTNQRNESLKLELARPYDTGLAVVGLSGIGPVEADVNMSEISTMDGALYNSSRKSYRLLGISLEFAWELYDVEKLRHKSYKYFPTKGKVSIEIETDERRLKTEGYVVTNDPSIFSNREGSEITIKCPDPYFYEAGTGQETVFSVESPMFEFEFEDDPTPSLELSSLDVYLTKLIKYDGDAEVGMIITIHATGSAEQITIYNYDTGEHLSINTTKLAVLTGAGITAGDDIIINTEPGHKSVTLVRAGVQTNILNCLDRGMTWLKLTPGDNILAYTTDPVAGASNLQLKVNNKLAYDGV